MLDDMDKLVSLCKRRGFIFPSSEIYGGINGFWDYGPLGVELKRNIKDAWWRDNVTDARRHGRARLLDHHEPEGLGGVGPRRRVQRPDGRLQGDQGALPGRPALRLRVRLPEGQRQGRADRSMAGRGRVVARGSRRGAREEGRQAGQEVRQARGTAGRRPLHADCRRGPRQGHRPLDRRARHAHRAAVVQPDVQDLRRRARERVERRLPAARDRPGDLRQLQERGRHRPGQDPVRHRPDRQELPQRDQAAELHVPLARVRADGDRVLLPARAKSADVVRVLARQPGSSGTSTSACRATGCGCATTTRTSWRSTRRPRPTSSTSSRSASASWRGSPTAATTT